MAKGLWRNNPDTPEGKYPIVLRRDGTPLENRFIVLTLRDPCTAVTLIAYAAELRRLGRTLDCENGGFLCERYGWSEEDAVKFAEEMEYLADESVELAKKDPGDPSASRHRKDSNEILEWAQAIGNPGA